jgi:EAL domain-containing protein (putative c-di-GMP-specific phosphodiesterase class I)
MYQAKNQGKNRFCYFTENLISDFDYNVKIERELQNALELDKFKLLYQPIIDSRTGHVSSFEALLRIEDSLLSPLQFIAVAENSGLIIAIGNQVIDQVCRQLRNWKANHGAIKPVAINISAKQLYDGKIVDYLKDTLAKYDIAPNLIEIEITESVLIENSDFNIALLSELRHLGFKISLDDFGTGYSSLSYEAYQKFKFDSEVYFKLKETELEVDQTSHRFSHREAKKQ